MIRPIRRALLPALAAAVLATGLLLGPRPAFALAVELRPDIAAPGGQVTLADLFEDAGAAGQVVVATGGAPGGSLVLDARAVQALAAEHGLEWANARGLNRLIARVESDRAVGARSRLAAGEVVQPEDVIWAAPSDFGTPLDAPRDARAVIGEAARRPLRAGTAVSLADLGAPNVIKRDEVVQVAYEGGGIRVVLEGKAMSSAAVGQAVDIMNPASKKVIQAVASGPDEAVVGPEAERVQTVANSNSNLFASLN